MRRLGFGKEAGPQITRITLIKSTRITLIKS